MSPAQDKAQTPTQTILEGILFMYALTNTNIAGTKKNYDRIFRCLGDYGLWIWCQKSLM